VSLSTLEDGIAALLANPLEQTTHRQVVDRVCEDSDDPRRALLDVVLRHRASDGPRLAYATWCEMNGEAERGEFIRVQCELARTGCLKPMMQNIYDGESYGNSPVDRIFLGVCGKCKPCRRHSELAERQGELLRDHYMRWGPSALLEPNDDRDAAVWGYARGFIQSLQCSARDWLRFADAVLSEQPVEKVTLTTTLAHGDYEDIRVKGCRWMVRSLEDAKLYLEAMFPGIEFQLPYVVTGNTSWATGTPTEVNVELTYVDEQVPVTNEFANYSQQLHDDLIRGLGIPASIVNPPK
jgi:uncharacterized protein (TIGR02996 family)